jgi:hypothetical protein
MPDDTYSDEPADAGGVPDGDATQAVPMGELFGDDRPAGAGAATGVGAAAGAGAGAGADVTGSMASGAAGGEPTASLGATGAAGGAGGGPAAAGGARPTSPSNRAWIIGLVVAAVLLAGAGIALAVTGGSSTKNPKKAAGSNAPNIPTQTIPPAGPPCPLTGVPTTGNQVPARPALAIKVDNYPQARPQSGLDKADLVFEEPVEGGITRLVAVFQCQSPALVGPIRSARAVDVQILDQLSRPLFIHAGGISPVISLLQGGNLFDENVFTHGSIVQSPPGRYAPYDTYVSAAAGWGLDPTDTTAPTALFTYSSTTPAGTAVTSLHIPFSGTNNTLWTWDASSGRWLLSYSGVPATAANSGQISAVNIVVQTVHVTYGPWLENDVGGLEVQSRMTGSGPLMVLRNGIAVSGTWERSSLSDPTSLVAADGSPIALQPGPTWVEIVPSTVPVTTAGPSSTATTP